MVTHFPKKDGLCSAHVTHHLDHQIGRTSSSGWALIWTSSFSCWRTARSFRGSTERVRRRSQGPISLSQNDDFKLGPVPGAESGEEAHWRPGLDLPLGEHAWQLLPYLKRLPEEHYALLSQGHEIWLQQD